MKVPFVDLTAQYAQIREEIRVAFNRVTKSGVFAGGEVVTGRGHAGGAACIRW